jgi:murein L,D-transpeptidase YcbB/YkuD
MSGALRRVDLANKEYGSVSPLFRILRLLFQGTKFTGLILILFLLASHDAANPKLGSTDIEFYGVEIRNGISTALGNDQHKYHGKISIDDLIMDFYGERNFLPAWTLNFSVNERFHELLELLSSAQEYGLFPEYYKVKVLLDLENKLSASLTDAQNIQDRLQLELLASGSALKFMIHLGAGIRKADTSKAFSDYVQRLPYYLNASCDNNTLRSSILDLQPKSNEYIRLQSALARYYKMASRDSAIYTLEQLRTSDSLVIDRLMAQGFLNNKPPQTISEVSEAIRLFQKANSIKPTGIVDNKTLKELSRSTADKFIKVSLNLNRIRKDELSDINCIIVNIPEFRLHYYNQQGEYTSFNVVVGKTDSRTPLLSSRINRMVINPYWTVPKSITHNEIIPKLITDSLFLQKHGYTVIDNYENAVDASQIDWHAVSPDDFNFWIRQDNNSKNALGNVKFLFPNKYSVYLHDTQSKSLFKKDVRAFSHGCVRVENSDKLAQQIMNDYMKSNVLKGDFSSLVKNKEEMELLLTDTLPIYIRYYTCTADSAGTIIFHPDIYQYDDASINDLLAGMRKI